MPPLFVKGASSSANVDDNCIIKNRNTPTSKNRTTNTYTPLENCDFEETISTPPKNPENYVKTLQNTTTNDSQSQNPSTPPPIEILNSKRVVQEERLKRLKETSSPQILALSNILGNTKPDVMQKLFKASQQHSVESYGNCAESLDNNQPDSIEKTSSVKPSTWVTLPGMETEQRREELKRVLNERQKKCHESDQ